MAEIRVTGLLGGGHKSLLNKARLRALARPGFMLKPFLKSVTPIEIGALLGFVVLVASVVLIYSFWILPDQVRFVQMSGQVADNEKKIAELQGQLADPGAVISEFETVRESLDTFRLNVLKPYQAGRIDIINNVSALSRETGVRLAGPVQFLSTDQPSIDTGDDSAQSNKKKSAARGASDVTPIKSYPALRMTFSVAGNYSQLRNFISRFEQSSQFVIIETIALNANETAGADTARGARAPAAVSDTVTLDIALTTYFQPGAPRLVPTTAAPTE